MTMVALKVLACLLIAFRGWRDMSARLSAMAAGCGDDLLRIAACVITTSRCVQFVIIACLAVVHFSWRIFGWALILHGVLRLLDPGWIVSLGELPLRTRVAIAVCRFWEAVPWCAGLYIGLVRDAWVWTPFLAGVCISLCAFTVHMAVMYRQIRRAMQSAQDADG